MMYCKYRENCFHTPRRRRVNVLSLILVELTASLLAWSPKHRLNCDCFGDITQWGGRTMCINVVDFCGIIPAFLSALDMQRGCAFTIVARARSYDMRQHSCQSQLILHKLLLPGVWRVLFLPVPKTPAPSPSTKPSRSISQGRLARCWIRIVY